MDEIFTIYIRARLAKLKNHAGGRSPLVLKWVVPNNNDCPQNHLLADRW